MAFEVVLTEDAERDIEDIYRHVAETDAVENADRLLTALDATCQGFATLPERGNVPIELRSLGIAKYREAHDKPYRILYRVVVYCVLDGRRDMQSLLQRRLLR